MWSMWSVAMLALAQSSVGSADGLVLPLLQAMVMGRCWQGDTQEKPPPPPYLLEKKCQLAGEGPLTCGVGMGLLPL